MDSIIPLSPAALGNALLVRVSPRCRYVNGQRIDTDVIGHRYELVLIDCGYAQVAVNISGPQQVAMPDDGTYPAVTITGHLEVYGYVRDGPGYPRSAG